ncbi:MAG: hypothetical protein WDN75_08435 [Bacteroidota bacterium]
MGTYSKNSAERPTTLSDCILKAEDMGYRENFKINSAGMIVENKRCLYLPGEIKIKHVYQFRSKVGEKEDSTLYLMETSDGRKGRLIDDPVTHTKVSDFINEVNEVNKPLGRSTTLMITLRNFFTME